MVILVVLGDFNSLHFKKRQERIWNHGGGFIDLDMPACHLVLLYL